MADKKISELPLITAISGSIVYVPIVHDGITEKITVENFSNFTNKYAAQTGSANIFTANQTINANLSVSGTSTVSGNASVGGNLVVNGKLTAQEIHTEITSASIIFESGSTIFGNSADDTHQFSGSVSINGISIGAGAINDFTASQLANDTRMLYITGALNSFTQSQIGKDGTLAEVTSSLRYFYETTSSLHAFTASQIGKDNTLGLVTSSFNAFTASQIGKDGTLAEVTSSLRYFYQTTSSLHAFTASQIGKDGTLGLVTSSFNDFTQSQIGKDNTLALVTSSFNAFTQSQIGKDNTLAVVTSSFNAFTQSQIGKDGTLALVTSSFNAFTQSQIGKDFTLSIVTSSLNSYTSSVIGQANTIAVFTASINAFTASQIGKDGTLAIVTSSINAHILKQATQTGSQDLVNYNISVVTSSIDAHILKQSTQTGSQDLVNYQNSVITSSYRIELNSIEAYTSSLKSAISVNGSNVQIIGELNVTKLNVQYISSSVLLTSGSNVFGDAITDKHEFTGSVNIKDTLYVNNTLFVNGQAIGLTELNAFTGSQIGKDFTLSVVTSSIDAHILKQATQTGSQDLVNYNISIVTSSIDSHILKQATQTGSQDLVNLGISTFTGSLRSEVNLIEAYTASLKAAAIVSSSQQITNYYKFAETASANTFYGNQTFSSSLLDVIGDGISINRIGGQPYVYLRKDTTDLGSVYGKTGGGLLLYNVSTAVITVNSDNTTTFADNIIMANGKGIDFSATANSGSSVQSEILNDYEAGSWTPTVEAVTGTYTTVTNQRGTYTKIGRLVTVHFYFIVSNKGTGAGGFNITNLPYPVLAMSAGDAYIGSGINTSNSIMFNIQAIQGTTTCSGYRYDGTDSIIATNGNNGTVTYITYP